ncbi:MAG: 3-oxoacyl-ACP reductase FabG [Chloroflexi bacterium]|nr:3-oxoacyl-ACP reductase FabG [Chloroflexota bacterium]
MDLRFDDKVVLVTGASSGIGRAVALAFGASGAKTAVNCFRHREAAEETAGAIRQAGGAAIVCPADVTDRAAVEQMVAQVNAELGPIDVLVNNAGAGLRLCPLVEMSDEHWDRVMAVNLRSAFLCCRAVAPQMIGRSSGVIVNISSVVAHHGGGPGELAYTTAKGGLSAFTRGLARELSKYHIRANTVAPGPTDTPFHEGVRTRQALESIVGRIPLGRLGLADDMTGAVLFLASDAAGYITGQSIEVNGGFWLV